MRGGAALAFAISSRTSAMPPSPLTLDRSVLSRSLASNALMRGSTAGFSTASKFLSSWVAEGSVHRGPYRFCDCVQGFNCSRISQTLKSCLCCHPNRNTCVVQSLDEGSNNSRVSCSAKSLRGARSNQIILMPQGFCESFDVPFLLHLLDVWVEKIQEPHNPPAHIQRQMHKKLSAASWNSEVNPEV